MGSLVSRSKDSAVDTYEWTTPFHNMHTQDVFQSIISGRKSWKTLRAGEVVWTPELEAALIEGFKNHKLDESRERRGLGRFPMRNRFISDWIFEKTGKRRTAKQVGSRLQQLRDMRGSDQLSLLYRQQLSINSDFVDTFSPSGASNFKRAQYSHFNDKFKGPRNSNSEDNSSPARASMFAGANGVVMSGGNFIIDQRTTTTTTQALSIQNILPYSLLAIQSTLTAKDISLNFCARVKSEVPPFELTPLYRMPSFDPYSDASVIFIPFVFWYLWRMMFFHPSLSNM